METNQQQDLMDLIQKTIRMEFNNYQQYQQSARNYNRNNRYNNSSNNNGNNKYRRYNNNRIKSQNIIKIYMQLSEPSVTKRVTTRSHIEEVNPTIRPKASIQPQHIDVDMDLPIQEKPNRKSPRVKRTQPDIKYDIALDLLRYKADIAINDLITVAPSLRRKLVSECRPKRKPKQYKASQQLQQTMVLLEDELNTTTVYSTPYD
ncbi:hypothetical protein G6F45_004642 [Rhizopus arrhizus]|uniref:Uncharacterized protein n=2 Tax=Rhizopus TaxID=4842 RepID=A0A9P6Z5V1_9FUNG|nr:hypothetical protein G6F52_001790 [Rhizopus delemar]KAG1541594.1 hypothetical protein G6F51_007796 [Rhizopus arrhizus]KAG1571332.1 hypothetical protein G6F50_004704 [Rhizopus delemar]KAG1631685.1 hypothetical protein G6F45_004642 [Rhizopus arrhizus]